MSFHECPLCNYQFEDRQLHKPFPRSAAIPLFGRAMQAYVDALSAVAAGERPAERNHVLAAVSLIDELAYWAAQVGRQAMPGDWGDIQAGLRGAIAWAEKATGHEYA